MWSLTLYDGERFINEVAQWFPLTGNPSYQSMRLEFNGYDTGTGPDLLGVAPSIRGTSVVPVSAISKVAVTGEYDDLKRKPTLGNSAELDVGTGANTVAAGDDARILAVADKVNKSGDTMAGDLKIGNTIYGLDGYINAQNGLDSATCYLPESPFVANRRNAVLMRDADLPIRMFATNAAYKDGELVLKGSNPLCLYRCNATPWHLGAWDDAHFTKILELATDEPAANGTALVTNGAVHAATALNPVWKCTPSTLDGHDIEIVPTENNGVSGFVPRVNGVEIAQSKPFSMETTKLEWTSADGWQGEGTLVARLQWVLGGKTNQPLQPAGDYLVAEDFNDVQIGNFSAKKILVKEGGTIEFSTGSSI